MFFRPATNFARAWSLEFRFLFLFQWKKGERERVQQKITVQRLLKDRNRSARTKERQTRKKKLEKKKPFSHQHGVPGGSTLSAVAAAAAMSPTRCLSLRSPSPELGT